MKMKFLELFTFQRYIAGLNTIAVLVHATNVVLLGVYHMGYEVPLRYTETTFAASTNNPDKITNEAFSVTKEWTTVNVVNLFMMNEGIALFSALLGLANTVNSSNKKIIYYETIRRWIEFALTAAFLEVILLLILGETDLFSLTSIWVLIVIQQICGYLGDTEETNGTHKFLYYFIGFSILVYQQTFVILKAFSATGISDRDRTIIPIINAVMYSLFGFHQYFSDASNWYSIRFNKHTYYILLSFCTKTIVTWLSFISLRHIIEEIQPKYVEYSVDWYEAFNITLYVVLSFFVVVSGFLYTVRPYDLRPRIKKGSVSENLIQKQVPAPSVANGGDEVIEIACRDGIPLMGANIPMLGPESYFETDSLL